MSNIIKSFLCVLLHLTTTRGEDQELQFKIMEHHTIESPITQRELDEWATAGASVMMPNSIVLVPEVSDRRGALYNLKTNENVDQWIIEARVKIGNSEKTRKGGNGVGFYYLSNINKDEMGQGLFGYSKQFDGLGVFLNSVLSSRDGDKQKNYIQAFSNDGTKQINSMKLTQSDSMKNCKASFRNIPDDKPFVIRIEYTKPTITVLYQDGETFVTCLTMTKELDFNGIFLITAGSAIRNPDKVLVEQFALYNPQIKVSEGHNKHVHEVHRQKAIHDMANYDSSHLTKDLIHSTDQHFTKDQFGEENLLDMLPTQLTNTKTTLQSLLKEMYNNYNYFYKVTAPLHMSLTFKDQINSIDEMVKNMTELSLAIDTSKARLDGLEQDVLSKAETEFARKDQNINMSQDQKDSKFDDAMAEFESSINTITKKFAVVDRKLEEMGDLTDDFHKSTDELEELYKKDIEQRKTYFNEQIGPSTSKEPKVNLKQIDELFDKVEAEEELASHMMLFTLPNLSMLAVIFLSAYIYMQLEKLGGKSRTD